MLHVKSNIGFEHVLVVQVPEADYQEDYTSATRHAVKDVLEIGVDAEQTIAVRVCTPAGSDTLELFSGNVTVKHGGGAGIAVEPMLAGWGETPDLSVSVDLGYDVDCAVTTRVVGKEMFSRGMLATELYDSPEAASLVSLDMSLPDTVRAFKGDSIYVWIDLGDVGEFAFADTLGGDLPGTMKHAVVTRASSTPSGSSLWNIYAEHADVSAVYGAAEGNIPIAFRQIIKSPYKWDGVADYTTQTSSYRSIGEQHDMHNTTNPDTTQYLLFYCPIHELVPAGSFVVDARLNIQASTSFSQGNTDTLLAVMMSRADDDQWHTLLSYGSRFGMAHASWKNQIQGQDDCIEGNASTLAGRGAPTTSSAPWSPSLDNRRGFADWGDVYQFTSEPHPTNGYNTPRWSSPDWYGFQITKIVTAAAGGAVYNGMVLAWMDNASTVALVSARMPDHATAAARPFFTLSWIEGYDPGPLLPGGATLIASMNSDDGHKASNEAWSQKADSLGISITINVNIQELGSYYDADDLRTWRARGMEIGAHSRVHPLYGTAQYCSTGSVGFREHGKVGEFGVYDCDDWAPPQRTWPEDIFSKAGSGTDSLLVDFDPCWLYAYMGAQYLNDPYVGKALALPNNRWNQQGIEAARRLGYTSIRTTRAGPGNLYGQYGHDAQWGWFDWRAGATSLGCGGFGTSESDSTRISFVMHYPWSPVNVMLWAPSFAAEDLVGPREVTFTEDELRARVRYQAQRHIGRKQPIMHWFTHDIKSGPYGDTTAIDPWEFVIVVDELQKLGAVFMNSSDVLAWKYAVTTPLDLREPWAQPAPYQWTKEDGIWRRPYWIRGVQIYGGIPRLGS